MKINTILFAIICISVLCITYTNASSQQLLKPIKQGTKQVGIVFVQGAQIAPEAYLPLAKKIQKESALSIYIVIPAFALNTPEPLVLSSGIKNGIKAMYDAGLDKNADLIMMGHSLGGAMLQDYVFKCTNCTMYISNVRFSFPIILRSSIVLMVSCQNRVIS